MSLLGQVVGSCAECGEDVLNTEARLSAHGPLEYAKHIGGSEYDALLKQSGYVPDGRYGHGGSWEAPALVHVRCAPAELIEACRATRAVD